MVSGLFAQPTEMYYRAWAQTEATMASGIINTVSAASSGGTSYLATSTLNVSNSYSVTLSKYNSSSALLWSAVFDVNTAGNAYVGGITLDASGNVILTGSAYNGTTNQYDLFTVKYNSSGTKQWQHLYNGSGGIYDFGAAVACSSGGDIYVTGGALQSSTGPDVLTICYNSSGTVQWTQTWDNTSLADLGALLVVTPYYVGVTGFTQTNATTWEYVILRYGLSTGTLLSTNVTSLGGTTLERISAATSDASGNIYITGALGASGQGLNIKTIKLAPDLSILWTANWDGAANKDDAGRGVAVDASGNVYVAGYTSPTVGGRDAVLLKYSSSGSLTWTQTWDSGAAGNDEFAGIALTDGGDLFIGGYSTPNDTKDYYSALYDVSGTLKWSDTYNGYANGDDAIEQVTPDGLGNFIVAGGSGLAGSLNALSVKYTPHTLVVPEDEEVNAPFVEDRGQTLTSDSIPTSVSDLRYYTHSIYPNVYIFDDQVSYAFAHIDTVPATTDTLVRIDLTFPGAQADRSSVGLELQEAFNNYYLGHIPEGRELVPLNNKVVQPQVWPGIDVLYGQGQDGLFIRFIGKGNFANVKMAFAGGGEPTIQLDGSLLIVTPLEDLVLPRPTAMTVSDEGEETELEGQPEYELDESGNVVLSLGSYDPELTLVVKIGRERDGEDVNADPYWSTYYGGSGGDEVVAIDTDKENGDIYFTGDTESGNFPTLFAIQKNLQSAKDAFVGRFNYQGVQQWTTFYGGSVSPLPPGGPTQYETGLDIAVAPPDGGGNSPESIDGSVYFVGLTDGIDFPLLNVPGAHNDAEFDILTGSSPATRGFIVKLRRENGGREWATFFGGLAPQEERLREAVTTIQMGGNNKFFIGGSGKSGLTSGATFPTMPNPPDVNDKYSQLLGTAFIAEFGTSDELVWATRLACDGTPFNVSDIAVSADNNVIIVGGSNPKNGCITTFPLLAPEDWYLKTSLANLDNGDGWLMQFDQDRKLIWSTYFGGSGTDYIASVQFDDEGRVVVSGSTTSNSSSNFPLESLGSGAYFDGTLGGTYDVFITRFGKTMPIEYSTYFGGNQDEIYIAAAHVQGVGAYDGGCMEFDGDGNLVLAGSTKSSNLDDFNASGNTTYSMVGEQLSGDCVITC